jgi:putative nucleotidyltransferase with HDIG domain
MKVQRGMEDLLRVLVKTLETRDRYTSGHSVRVSVLARSIAEDLAMRPRQVKQVEQAALVHDIGKIEEVYADIIMKPHSLSDVEKLVIRTHATRGADFLKGLSSFPDDVIQGVRHHHERYDGAGYPDGMHGEAIPLVSRIIMICDSVDAMLSDRPYRKALSIDTVRAELQRCAGAQFDPKLVEVMLAKGTLERAVGLLQDAYPAHDEADEARVIEAAHRFKEGVANS